jgi:hemoglobin-like flavoprotein
MGCMIGGSAKVYSADEIEKLINIARSMPAWCIKNPVITKDMLALIRGCWGKIITGDTEPYRDLCAVSEAKIPKETPKSPIVFFHDTFYGKFFELDPNVKDMFKNGIKTQGHVLANIFSYIIKCAENDGEELVRTLKRLAISHNSKPGIMPYHYSIVGLVLLHTLRVCAGKEIYTEEVDTGWRVVYSKMMEVMMPVVVEGTTEQIDDGKGPDIKPTILAAVTKRNTLNGDSNSTSNEDEKRLTVKRANNRRNTLSSNRINSTDTRLTVRSSTDKACPFTSSTNGERTLRIIPQVDTPLSPNKRTAITCPIILVDSSTKIDIKPVTTTPTKNNALICPVSAVSPTASATIINTPSISNDVSPISAV